MMPDRLDRVTIALNHGDVTITWEARQALMRRLQELATKQRIRDSFQAVGATLVELNAGQRATLLTILEDWCRDGAFEPMPEELTFFRAALADDLNDGSAK